MADRYASLASEARVFRTTRPGSGHFPQGHRLPIPEWLEPQREDIDEGMRSGRPAGLSVWATPPASHLDACQHRGIDPAGHRSFVVAVSAVRSIASAHTRSIDVVSDPIDFDISNEHHATVPVAARERFCSSLAGHSLVEGIRRPDGLPKGAHRVFLAKLAGAFDEFEDEP